ncbi:MAG TPA: Fe-S cluster assembly protein SufD [Solirubrobacteraceae bacterium]|nr:Fe-S cluster assembly protein SufD [Solirubrobacteraceae bacterium]
MAESTTVLELPTHKGRPGWEFTDLGDFSLEAWTPAPAGGTAVEAARLLEPPGDAVEIVQVDGASDAGDTFPGGVIVMPLSAARERHPELVEPHFGTVVAASDAFTALNERDWTAGAFVYVPRGVQVEAPIVLTAIGRAAGSILHRRVLIVLEEGAEAEVWEQYLSGDAETETVFNTVVELKVGQNANLRYVCGQELNERSWIFGSQRAEVARDGSLEWVVLGFGSGRGKVRTETLLAGEGADAKVTGAYAPHGRQHIDFDTTQEHGAPNTTSDLAFRGILADRASAVWRGMIKVDPGAQQTDAFQECRNLLLSKRAHADAIPGLEILANDVRCTHAAAVAQIDREQLFYLRSRGLDEASSTRLVIEGFMAELVERFEEGPVREALSTALERRLATLLA